RQDKDKAVQEEDLHQRLTLSFPLLTFSRTIIGGPPTLRSGEGFDNQPFKMLDPFLVLDHEPTLVVEPGVEPALHRLADEDSLPLDLIDERQHGGSLLHPFLEVEVVDGQGPTRCDRKDEVRGGVPATRVEIDHEVRPDVVVEPLLPTTLREETGGV